MNETSNEELLKCRESYDEAIVNAGQPSKELNDLVDENLSDRHQCSQIMKK